MPVTSQGLDDIPLCPVCGSELAFSLSGAVVCPTHNAVYGHGEESPDRDPPAMRDVPVAEKAAADGLYIVDKKLCGRLRIYDDSHDSREFVARIDTGDGFWLCARMVPGAKASTRKGKK